MDFNIKNIGLLLIATGKYDSFLDQLLEGANEHFLTNHNVTFFLFTDSQKKLPQINVCRTLIEHKPWPFPTLERYHHFAKSEKILETQDYLFYCDVDMKFVDTVGDEVLSERVSTIHPGHYGRRGDPETNPKSLACVNHDEQLVYYAGGFQGGEAKEFLRMSKQISTNIDIDKQNGIIAKWHDESHMNRWRIDNPPTKVLDCGYCYQQSLHRPHRPRILALDKNHIEFGNFGSGGPR